MLHFTFPLGLFFFSENVALNRSAWQYYPYPGRPWGAERAVDGHKSNLSEWGSVCNFWRCKGSRMAGGPWKCIQNSSHLHPTQNRQFAMEYVF